MSESGGGGGSGGHRGINEEILMLVNDVSE